MKKWACLAATFCLYAIAGSDAIGSCVLPDLNGAWRVYAQGGPALWTKCTVEVVEGIGKVASDRVCEDGKGNSYLTTGGQLSINDVCRVSGFVDTQAGRITIRHSFLEANSNGVWTGIAISDADGSNLMFTAVRGLPSEIGENNDKPVDTELSTMLALVNQARAVGRICGQEGYFPPASPVSWNDLLAQAAQRHSDDMANNNFFSHIGSDGTNVANRVTDTGYDWSAVGENIAAGYETVQSVVQAWLDSPGHCANIMQPLFEEMGAAKAVNPNSYYQIYWTQVFAAPW
ncbi:MAG: CAP domain-containing protein [Chromatiaceae bacterium]